MKQAFSIETMLSIILLFILSSCQKEKMMTEERLRNSIKNSGTTFFQYVKDKYNWGIQEKERELRERELENELKLLREEQARLSRIEKQQAAALKLRLEREKLKLEQEKAEALLLRNNTKMDVIWVIDNTGSMRENREQLKDKFQYFIAQFAAFGFDFRNVILTTDYRERGKTYGDTVSLTREVYREDPDFFVESFTEALSAIESRNSVYVERGFANVRHFMGIKEGKRFLSRKDAYTIIIFVSDEDDQSQSLLEKKRQHLLSVERYIHRFKVVTKKNANQGLLKVYSVVNLLETKLMDESFNHETVGTRYIEASMLTGGSAIDIHDNFTGILDSILHLPTLPLAREVGVEATSLGLTY